MESILNISKVVIQGVRRDIRVRWGLGAGASVLLSAGVLGLGGSFTPQLLHASAAQRPIIPEVRTVAQGLAVVDMSTSTVFEIIDSLPKAERFDLMLYNSGADETLKKVGTYTVFVPASADFDYLPQGYISSLSRMDLGKLAQSHIVSRALPLDTSLNGTIPTLGGTQASFTVSDDLTSATVGDAKVLKVYKASNGYVYIIDKVLAPAGN